MYYIDVQAASQLAVLHLEEQHASRTHQQSYSTQTKQPGGLARPMRWLVWQLGHKLVILGRQLEGFGTPQPSTQ